MNKTELIEQIADRADISKATASRALDATIAVVKNALNEGEVVSLSGFGTFTVSERAARDGRNPRSGASVKIKASRSAKFRAGKALKDALNEEQV